VCGFCGFRQRVSVKCHLELVRTDKKLLILRLLDQKHSHAQNRKPESVLLK